MPYTGEATAREETATHRDHSQPKERVSRRKAIACEVEDRLDYRMVRQARALAAKRGEKTMAWADFKKKL